MANKKSTTRRSRIIGKEEYIRASTGAVEEFQVVSIEEKDFNFQKIWLAHVLDAINEIGNRKIELLMYLLEQKDYNNKVTLTVREISDETGVSSRTIIRTLKALEEHDIIQRKTGVIQFNPSVIFKGNYNQRMGVLIQYNKLKQGHLFEDDFEDDKLASAAD